MSSELVERLRSHREAFGVHYEPREVEVCIEAAARIEALEAEKARLAAALEPFANAAKAYLIEELDDDYRPDWSPFIPYGAYRAARRVREGGNADG